jgi:hypothetical protein
VRNIASDDLINLDFTQEMEIKEPDFRKEEKGHRA